MWLQTPSSLLMCRCYQSWHASCCHRSCGIWIHLVEGNYQKVPACMWICIRTHKGSGEECEIFKEHLEHLRNSKKKKSGELKLCLVGEISRRRKNSFCIVMNWGGCSFWNYLFERRIDHKQLISKIVKDLQMKIEKNQKEKALRFSRHRNILASSAPLKCWENINI